MNKSGDEELWTKTLDALRGDLSQENIETWLAPLSLSVSEAGALTFSVPNRFYCDWVSTHYLDAVLEKIHTLRDDISSAPVAWKVVETPAKPEPAEQPRPSVRRAEPKKPVPADLNPRYKFETFIVGPSNQLAHAASSAVGSEPGTRYNPLFMYSGVGLGKTHLLNAVGHEISARNQKAVVRYVSAELFTNEFIAALRNHEIEAFRKKYRQECDALLVDDIQFLAGREQTQEEFFHTFNALYHRDCQIVLTSDMVPQQLAGMQERLVSRFSSGLVADLQPPAIETRVAILQNKAEQEKIHLPTDVAFFVAEQVEKNVRELEGTLLRIAVQAQLLHQPINKGLAKQVLSLTSVHTGPVWTIDDVQKLVCEHFRLRITDLRSSKRARSITYPRMVAMYLCRQYLGASYPEIGEHFGGKDHTTVINAVRKITHLIEHDDNTRSAVETLERKLA